MRLQRFNSKLSLSKNVLHVHMEEVEEDFMVSRFYLKRISLNLLKSEDDFLLLDLVQYEHSHHCYYSS